METNAKPQQNEVETNAERPAARHGLARVTFEDTPMPQALRAMRRAIEDPPTDAPDSSNPRSGIVAMSEPVPSERLQIDVDSLPPPPSLRPASAPPPRLTERLAGRKVLRRVLDLIQDFLFTRSVAFALELARSSWHSGYDSLHVLFRSIRLQEGEIAVDIGSGLGRVVAFLSHRFRGHKVIGIEADKTALFAQRAFAKNPDVEIRYGDFIESYPNEATLFYIYPPTEGDFLRKLKGLVDERATKDTTVVARGALGGLGYFRQDPSWTVESVSPPEGALRRLVSTYFIYEHHRRGPGYHYGVILRKKVSAKALPAPEKALDASAKLPLPPSLPSDMAPKRPSEPAPATPRNDRR
ncbi:MAG: class I SAM-dependent methyltransferase [Polyangiaceae bacterium]